jgi:hypothetical protein
MRRAFAPLFLAALCLPAHDLLPPEVLMLSRIRARVRQAIDHLPDCTCIETVSRFQRAPGKDFRPIDRVVFQVLFSGDNELFSWPGDTRWENSPFGFVSAGMLGNGLFALHLKAIFLNGQSLIKYHGMEEPAGRALARYDFSISRMMSGYSIHRLNATGVVATRGSFWADPDTYDLRRIEFHAEEIPPELLFSDITTAIDYERVRLGETEVLLPQTADLATVSTDGSSDRDLIEFTHCQAFHTDSTLNFEPPTEPAAQTRRAAPKSLPEGALPVDLRVTIALTSGLTDHAAVGSLVEGKVVGNVMQKAKVFVPSGARVEGRVRRLERYSDSAKGEYFLLAIEFTNIETPDRIVPFYAGLEQSDSLDGLESPTANPLAARSTPVTGPMAQMRVEHVSVHQVPGVGTFVIHRPHFLLPAGFKTVWKTQLYQRSATP